MSPIDALIGDMNGLSYYIDLDLKEAALRQTGS
jgi:hypothetical protein